MQWITALLFPERIKFQELRFGIVRCSTQIFYYLVSITNTEEKATEMIIYNFNNFI